VEERGTPRPLVEYLAELPETRRVALVLRHVMGYSIEEIAELTEVSPNTVKDRLLRAREQVRKTLRRELSLLPGKARAR
jgi:RNA polymerase sigma-70 factor (ECF subfamily)